MARTATIHRKTNETDIRLKLNLDGRGKACITTGIRFFDHMLDLVARHGAFDLEVNARGDLDVDQHHTVEDVGITLGEAVQKALGSKRGILRAGYFLMPMDETLAAAAVDLSGRPCCVVKATIAAERVGDFQVELMEDFCTDVLHITKWRRRSRRSRERCGLPWRKISACEEYCPAQRGFYEGHHHRLRSWKCAFRRARARTARRRVGTHEFT
jgi:imidazoleglycerol phosphate dehydratase HisB